MWRAVVTGTVGLWLQLIGALRIALRFLATAISNLTASYASASEYYVMNIYGKDASAYYDVFFGLRHLKRGETKPRLVATERNDTLLDEFARCVRTGAKPETDGVWASRNLAVIKAGIRSAREGRATNVRRRDNERRVEEGRKQIGQTSAKHQSRRR